MLSFVFQRIQSVTVIFYIFQMCLIISIEIVQFNAAATIVEGSSITQVYVTSEGSASVSHNKASAIIGNLHTVATNLQFIFNNSCITLFFIADAFNAGYIFIYRANVFRQCFYVNAIVQTTSYIASCCVYMECIITNSNAMLASFKCTISCSHVAVIVYCKATVFQFDIAFASNIQNTFNSSGVGYLTKERIGSSSTGDTSYIFISSSNIAGQIVKISFQVFNVNAIVQTAGYITSCTVYAKFAT